MSTHRNRVQMTVSGTPGTGTITLGSASSGYQSFANAYGANATVDILIVDGTAWEVARDCTYTNSGTTVTRGTLEASSTGSAISLTSAAIVSVIATADRGRTWDAAALNTQVAGTDADTTMAVNTLYTVDMSAWATADRTYTLPATAAVGDMVGIAVTAGDASHELLITAASGDTLNGVSGGTEWSRLFITGEVVVMRCVAANATWVVVQDGRIPMQSLMILTTPTDGVEAAATYYRPATNQGGAWTVQFDVGSISAASSDGFVSRRACKAFFTAAAYPKVALADTKYINVIVTKTPGTPTLELYARVFSSTNAFAGVILAGTLQMDAGQTAYYMYRNEDANVGLTTASATSNTVFYSFTEIL